MLVLRAIVGGLLVAVALGLNASSDLWAHPFHTTTAEMEYNAQSGRFEVTLKIPAFDLEEALTRQTALGERSERTVQGSPRATSIGGGQRVQLDQTPNVEQLIASYLNAHFFLTSRGNYKADPNAQGDAVGVSRATATAATTDNVVGAPANATTDEKPTQGEAQRSNPSLQRSRLNWLAMELDKSSAWLYFELEPPHGDKLSLVNELFFELNAEQINTCTLRALGTKFSLRTDARHPQVALPPQARTR